jgi:ABC-type dipeptide/oligopeptide/nickel transport system ATPase component
MFVCVCQGRANAVLEIQDLNVDYCRPASAPVQALDGISLSVSAGECVGVLGESGSGKSTLGLSLIRALPPGASIRSGMLRFMGMDILAASERDLRQVRCAGIAVIFQQPGMTLSPFLTVQRQVAEVIRAHREPRWTKREAMHALEQVFGAAANRISRAYLHELSGGERQRVSIAQALACRPQLIVADEPTAALDSVVQSEIIKIFRRLKGHCAMLFMTHDARILAGLADRIIVLQRGRMIDQGDLLEMYRHPRSGYTAGLLGAAFQSLRT